MRLRVHFGLIEVPRETNWWQGIGDFPTLVIFKGLKWEFVMYGPDASGRVDYNCNFAEVMSYDPNFHATTYVDVSGWFDSDNGVKCDCGAVYSGIPWDHMRFCPKWVPWKGL